MLVDMISRQNPMMLYINADCGESSEGYWILMSNLVD